MDSRSSFSGFHNPVSSESQGSSKEMKSTESTMTDVKMELRGFCAMVRGFVDRIVMGGAWIDAYKDEASILRPVKGRRCVFDNSHGHNIYVPSTILNRFTGDALFRSTRSDDCAMRGMRSETHIDFAL